MKQLYKKEICINCANINCTNRIEIIKKLELLDQEIKTTTTIKCKDFVCKNKRREKKANWATI